MKKVIFVGGTSYSGSTFFHLTLANDPAGFAIGEVRHLFHPTKPRHFDANWGCGCQDPTCDLWSRVKRNGIEHLYETIFDIHPEVEFIVDSSKNVYWIKEQSDRLARQGITPRHIVMWKTPVEWANSLMKRNHLDQLGGWPLVHRRFLTLFEDWRAIKYADYTGDQAANLQAACAYLGIPYFEGKERYWEKIHHYLGGNLTARLHLYSQDSAGYQDIEQRAGYNPAELNKAKEQYRNVYYEKPQEELLTDYLKRLYKAYPETGRVVDMLQAFDVKNDAPSPEQWSDLRVTSQMVLSKRLRMIAREQYNHARIVWKARFGF